MIALKKLIVKSSVFDHNGFIPAKYTCDGDDINPPLHIENLPKETKSLVLIVDDPDAPRGTWDHWVVWNITPRTEIKEDNIPGTEGLNSFGRHSYGGPCPPSGTHRYYFKVYALDAELNLRSDSKKRDVEQAMDGHILSRGELVCLYKRK